MTGFMSDTLEKFRDANEKYKTAKKTFVDLKNLSTRSKDKVEKMLIEGSAEQEDWKKVVRDAVKEENNIPELAKKLRDEINVRWDAIVEKAKPKDRPKVKAAIEADGGAAIDREVNAQIEFAITGYNTKLKKLKEVTVNMLESGKSFEDTIDNAMNILGEKITNITDSANVFGENKDEEEIFTKYQNIRTDLIQGLDDLKNSAETFLSE